MADTSSASDFDRAEEAIMRVMQKRRTANPDTVLSEASETVRLSPDVLRGALQTLVGQQKIRFNMDLLLELSA